MLFGRRRRPGVIWCASVVRRALFVGLGLLLVVVVCLFGVIVVVVIVVRVRATVSHTHTTLPFRVNSDDGDAPNLFLPEPRR